ncbi:MAG: four-carbon acid sugar kinase family protein, partial [Oscillospiraceae bacterium]|nr:four-carbon acid sugar kinase family protein [Oscillospiraceae bacterium]
MIPKLFIAADDFTGALDTGVQFAKEGVSTRVFCSGEAVFKGVEVVVVNTESRHLPAKAAEEKVRALTEIAKRAGVKYFYKKTDSALRGNVGAELTGMLHASGESALAFIPAYPALNRITERGVHYIDGVPAAESVFAKDPFEPVTESEV